MSENKAKKEEWTTVITAEKNLFSFSIRELYEYRDLIILFVRRDFVTLFKQTILGPLWFFIQPLLTMAIFVVVFGRIARIPTDDIPRPVFYLSGIVIWNFFSACLTKTADLFLSNAGILKKVYFPRLAIPISVVITNSMKLGVQLVLFFLLLGYYLLKVPSLHFTWYALLFPLLILHLALLGFSVGLIVSSLTTKYRDLNFLVQFGVQLWMYATPIVYPMSQIPARWRFLFLFNPVAPIVEVFRKGFVGAGSVSLTGYGISIAITLFLCGAGIILFNAIERTFVDTV